MTISTPNSIANQYLFRIGIHPMHADSNTADRLLQIEYLALRVNIQLSGTNCNKALNNRDSIRYGLDIELRCGL